MSGPDHRGLLPGARHARACRRGDRRGARDQRRVRRRARPPARCARTSSAQNALAAAGRAARAHRGAAPATRRSRKPASSACAPWPRRSACPLRRSAEAGRGIVRRSGAERLSPRASSRYRRPRWRRSRSTATRARRPCARTSSPPRRRRALDDVLSAFARQRAMSPGPRRAGAPRGFTATAARVLARLELAQGAPLPAALEALAREIVLAPSLERAEALATELRAGRAARRAKRESAQRARRRRRAALAARRAAARTRRRALVAALERVAAGVAPLDDRRCATTPSDCSTPRAAERERAEQAAAAYVLEQSLRDLGYEVEDIEATLFADGGTVNFRRAGLGRLFRAPARRSPPSAP